MKSFMPVRLGPLKKPECANIAFFKGTEGGLPKVLKGLRGFQGTLRHFRGLQYL
jgi:hypothetical protein